MDMHTHRHHGNHPPAAPALKDPVCGMTVTEQSEHKLTHEGRPYYFCSAKCQSKFAANPLQYLVSTAPEDIAQKKTGTIYTCPMHPEVRQIGPGNCPICGMALEPVIATGETGDSAELRDMSRRFWIGLVLSLPVLALEMGGHLLEIKHLVGAQTSNLIQMLLGTPVVLWAC